MDGNADIEYVGFWARVGAALIDTILMVVVSIPLLRLVYALSGLDQGAHTANLVELAVSYVLPAVLVVLLWIKLSSTPGKMAIGAIIIDADSGGKPSTTQFVIRYLGYYVSIIPLFLGLIWVGIDPRKQGWHDKMARTVVIRKRAVMRP